MTCNLEMHKKQFEIERETKKKNIFSSEKVKSQFNLGDYFNISRSYRNSFTLGGVV